MLAVTRRFLEDVHGGRAATLEHRREIREPVFRAADRGILPAAENFKRRLDLSKLDLGHHAEICFHPFTLRRTKP
jgi:hypothetical protein